MTDKNIDLAPAGIPEVGTGVTLCSHGELLPATVLRVSPSRRTIWFRLDEVAGSVNVLARDISAHTYRAVRHPDGVYRSGHEMWRVEVGVRRVIAREGDGAGAPDGLKALEARVERLEPWLLRRRWYSMTYMVIPSVLRSADELLAELATYSGPQRHIAQALHARLAGLRTRFGRDS